MLGTVVARLKILLTWYKMNDYPHEFIKGVPAEWLPNPKNLEDNIFNTKLGQVCKKDGVDKDFIPLFKQVCTEFIKGERSTSDRYPVLLRLNLSGFTANWEEIWAASHQMQTVNVKNAKTGRMEKKRVPVRPQKPKQALLLRQEEEDIVDEIWGLPWEEKKSLKESFDRPTYALFESKK